jgi:hypothetical protein
MRCYGCLWTFTCYGTWKKSQPQTWSRRATRTRGDFMKISLKINMFLSLTNFTVVTLSPLKFEHTSYTQYFLLYFSVTRLFLNLHPRNEIQTNWFFIINLNLKSCCRYGNCQRQMMYWRGKISVASLSADPCNNFFIRLLCLFTMQHLLSTLCCISDMYCKNSQHSFSLSAGEESPCDIV